MRYIVKQNAFKLGEYYNSFQLKNRKNSFASASGTCVPGLDHCDGSMRIVHNNGVDASSSSLPLHRSSDPLGH